MSPILTVVLVLVAAAVAGALGFYLGGENRKRTAEAKIGSAEEEAKRIVNDAIKAAEQKRKETIIEAKDEAFKLKSDADKEIKDRRAEITRQERRIDQKEEALDKRTAQMERKEEDLKRRSETVEARLDELEQLKLRQTEKLETIAAMSKEDARAVLLKQVDDELTHEKAMKISAYQANMKDECDNLARELIGQAIARCAADATSEATVSVVPLPSDEMKGRIIGREGRNIRALETATGCDLIIDDTPEAITLSSFDQTRREVARMALERLIADGRIHPARIEETVDKCRRELEIQMKREGDKAVMELGIHSLHPDLVKLIGRLKYRTSFGQNVLSHSLEVAWLAGLMAGELGVNVQLARRAGLLHDIGKALDHEIEGSHVQIGVDICKKYRENRRSSTPSRPTTATWSPRRRWRSSSWPPTRFPLPVPVPAARTWRATSSVWKHWRLSATALRASRAPTPCRQAARSASLSSPTRSATTRSFCWHAMSPRRSRTSWITPVRSRSASSARAEQPSTRSKIHNCYSNRQTVRIGGLPVLLYDAAGTGHARPAGFPARGCLFYSAGPHMCGPYCMAPQGLAQVLGLKATPHNSRLTA